jgi:phosphatidate cytidylyltransferase
VGSETPVTSAAPDRSELALRIFAAALFLPCAFVITQHGDLQFLFLVDVVILSGLWEFYHLLEAKGFHPARKTGVLCGLALSWYAYFRAGIYLNFLLSATLLVLMTVALTRRSVEQAVLHISSTIFGVLYVGWLGSHFVLLRELPLLVGLDYELGARFVFLAVLLTWACDSGAYFVGRSIGRHPLFPRVSPKKTWEGAAGGLTFSLVAGTIAHYTFASYLELPAALSLAVVASVAGVMGDLVESLMKRDSHVKDTARLIPGHGGTLDRFDSLLFSVPLIYYFLKFFVI